MLLKSHISPISSLVPPGLGINIVETLATDSVNKHSFCICTCMMYKKTGIQAFP